MFLCILIFSYFSLYVNPFSIIIAIGIFLATMTLMLTGIFSVIIYLVCFQNEEELLLCFMWGRQNMKFLHEFLAK